MTLSRGGGGDRAVDVVARLAESGWFVRRGGAETGVASAPGVEDECKLSCMFLIRLLMRDGGRGFFSGLTCEGSEGVGPPDEEAEAVPAEAAASADIRAS